MRSASFFLKLLFARDYVCHISHSLFIILRLCAMHYYVWNTHFLCSFSYRAIAAFFAYPTFAGVIDSSGASQVANALVLHGFASRSYVCAQDALYALMHARAQIAEDNLAKSIVKFGLRSKNTKLVVKSLAFILRVLVEKSDDADNCLDDLCEVINQPVRLNVSYIFSFAFSYFNAG